LVVKSPGILQVGAKKSTFFISTMISTTSDLQTILEKIDGGCVGVDLVKIGQNYVQQQANSEYNSVKNR
jgi:hypothetical protein